MRAPVGGGSTPGRWLRRTPHASPVQAIIGEAARPVRNRSPGLLLLRPPVVCRLGEPSGIAERARLDAQHPSITRWWIRVPELGQKAQCSVRPLSHGTVNIFSAPDRSRNEHLETATLIRKTLPKALALGAKADYKAARPSRGTSYCRTYSAFACAHSALPAPPPSRASISPPGITDLVQSSDPSASSRAARMRPE